MISLKVRNAHFSSIFYFFLLLYFLLSLIKVDNLTYRTTPEDLRRVFERCGSVGDIYIPRDRYVFYYILYFAYIVCSYKSCFSHTRESRGFAFVRFYEKRDAEEALQEMDGRVLDGRELRYI